jgi:hypothetical protein
MVTPLCGYTYHKHHRVANSVAIFKIFKIRVKYKSFNREHIFKKNHNYFVNTMGEFCCFCVIGMKR